MDGKTMFVSPRSYIPEVKLPQEVLQVLPPDPLSQLELAHRIACFAYTQKASQMEAEAQQYRESLSQKSAAVKNLELKAAALEAEVQDLHHKNARSNEEQHKLVAERNALIDTVRKLNRDFAKLESFKKNLLQSLNDESELSKAEPSLSSIHLSSERLVAQALNTAASAASASYTPAANGGSGAYSNGTSSSLPYPGTPTRASPGDAFSGACSSPPKLDGKEFFRHARSRLSSEQFSVFLQVIKDLNAGRQTKDQTLKRARDVFGITNADLYGMFESLLSRQINAL